MLIYTSNQMKKEDVLELYTLLEENGIEAWLDGGWAVDALLKKETRPHADLDIAVRHRNVPKLRELLAARGYEEIQKNDSSEWNFVLKDTKGRELDVHSFEFDDQGNNIYGVAYPKDSLTGTGTINGKRVKCISPEWVVKFHTGYKLKEKDFQDVKAFCKKFGIELPEEYK